MTMIAYPQSLANNLMDPPLEPWGSPEDIGCETLEGEVQLAGSFDLGSLDTAIFGGQFSATQGKYRVTYGFHEHATLIEGEVTLTDEASGESRTYGPGDSWIIAKGSRMIWHIHSALVRKSYLAVTADL